MNQKRFAIALAAASALFAASSALAQQATQVAVHDAWRVFELGSGGSKSCFMSSAPTQSSGAEGRRRGPVNLYVSNRPSDGVRDEVSVAIGYQFKPDAAAIEVAGRTYRLFTDGETAWSDGADAKLVEEMKAGSTLVVRATSSRGTDTRDTFSLRGFTAANGALQRACRVP